MKKRILQKITGVCSVKNQVIIETDKGKIRIKVLSENCFWITWFPGGIIPSDCHSWAVEKQNMAAGRFSLNKKSKKEIEIVTGFLNY